jgi:hypothetical protein
VFWLVIIAPGHEHLRVGGLATCSIKQPVITPENNVVACNSNFNVIITSDPNTEVPVAAADSVCATTSGETVTDHRRWEL